MVHASGCIGWMSNWICQVHVLLQHCIRPDLGNVLRQCSYCSYYQLSGYVYIMWCVQWACNHARPGLQYYSATHAPLIAECLIARHIIAQCRLRSRLVRVYACPSGLGISLLTSCPVSNVCTCFVCNALCTHATMLPQQRKRHLWHNMGCTCAVVIS